MSDATAVVAHPFEPLCVTGGFGAGKTTALAARAAHLRASGRIVLELARPSAAVSFAAELLLRHGRPGRVVDHRTQRSMVARLLHEHDWGELSGERGDPQFADEVAATVLRYQSSFLGAEELFVHADAAGEFERWAALDGFTHRYLDEHERSGTVDRAGAVVGASLLLRDPEVMAVERNGFDDLLVDDFQLADFATNRLLTQLAGRAGSLTVAGNAAAAIGSEHGWSSRFLGSFARRFACEHLDLGDVSWRRPSPPVLVESIGSAHAHAHVLPRQEVIDAVGREWPVVVIPHGTAESWPAPRPTHRWFDPHLFGGPDVPSDAERDERWGDEERRRFTVACTRATEQTVLVVPAGATATPLLAEVRPPSSLHRPR